jgi:hypothetical protein
MSSSMGVPDHAGHPESVPVTEASLVEPHPEFRGLYMQSAPDEQLSHAARARLAFARVGIDTVPAPIPRYGKTLECLARPMGVLLDVAGELVKFAYYAARLDLRWDRGTITIKR